MQQASIWPRVSLVSVGAIVLLGLFVPLAMSGLWDPHELDVADWGRRVAVSLLEAGDLAASATTNDVPTVEEVGRGELPILAIALSLKLFGLHQWAARLPMALFGLLGICLTATVCWRLNSRKSALWVALILSGMPLYFVHARSALGDAATMACLAGAFAGFAISVFDSRASLRLRVGFWGVGVACAGVGFFCRGALVNVAVPGLGVGLSWLLLFGAEKAEYSGRMLRLSDGLGAATLTVGLVGAVAGLTALFTATPQDYWLALGGTVAPPRQFTTHDFVIRYLGHGLFPWSAVAPLACGLLLRAPRGNERQRAARGALRLSLFLSLVLAVAAYGLLAPRTGLWPFSAVFALAALIALAFEEFELKPEGAPIFAMASAALLVLIFKDFDNSPDRVYSAFGLPDGTMPAALERSTAKYILASAAPALGVFALFAVERIGFMAFAMRWVTRKIGSIRGWSSLAALTAGGLILSAGYYPRLASLVSPKGAFDAYERHAKAGEPLAVLGTDQRSALYLGREIRSLRGETEAISWLDQTADSRHWLLVDADGLASLNSRYRRARGRRGNLPVLARATAETLLVSDRLLPGEQNENPLMALLPSEKPSPQYPLTAEFEGKLRLLGWAILDSEGLPASEVTIGKPHQFVLCYEVLGRITRDWRTFIHIDGGNTRFNGDHATLDEQYPFRLWNPGDYIVDTHAIELDSTHPPGVYQAYFGLFSGKERFKVTSGNHLENRIHGGPVRVVK